jgi:hypothetical protein
VVTFSIDGSNAPSGAGRGSSLPLHQVSGDVSREDLLLLTRSPLSSPSEWAPHVGTCGRAWLDMQQTCQLSICKHGGLHVYLLYQLQQPLTCPEALCTLLLAMAGHLLTGLPSVRILAIVTEVSTEGGTKDVQARVLYSRRPEVGPGQGRAGSQGQAEGTVSILPDEHSEDEQWPTVRRLWLCSWCRSPVLHLSC